MADQLDLSYIYDIADGNDQFILTLLEILGKNLNSYPPKMKNELSSGNLKALKETAHKFKSCTAYTGVTEFNQTLEDIEISVDERKNPTDIEKLVEKIAFNAVLLNEQVDKISIEIKQRAEQNI